MNAYCKKKNNFIYNIDIFGKEPELYYKGRSKRVSWIGRFFTVAYFVIYMIIFLYKFIKMIQKEEVTFYETYAYSGDMPSIEVNNQNFYGGFALGQIPFIDETIYYPKVEYYKGKRVNGIFNWETKELELEVCKLEGFDPRYRELFKDKPLNNLYCLKEDNVTLDGYAHSEVYSYFLVTFYKCMNTTKNGTPCQNSSVIDEYLENNVFQFFIQDIQLTPQNYSSPIQITDRVITGVAFKHLYQKAYAHMQMVIVETDQDFLGLNAFSKIKTEKFLKYDTAWFTAAPNQNKTYDQGFPLLEIYVQLSNNILTQRRTFVKLLDIFGEIGGTMEFIYTIFTIISSFLTDFLYRTALIHNLFSFDIDKKIIYIKENKQKFDDIINDISGDKDYKSFSNIEQQKDIKPHENLIYSNLNKDNNEINLNEKGKENKVLVTKKMKVSRRKSRKIKTSILPSLRTNDSIESKSKNNLNKDANNEEFRNKIIMKDLNTGIQKEERMKSKKAIIDRIKISKFSIFLCLPCIRKKKNINNYLLDEALKIIMEKLDILNIFRKLYRDEKIQEQFKVDNIIDMSDECKQKINEYKCKTV